MTTEQELLAEAILELVDTQTSDDAMPRGDLQGAMEALVDGYQLIEQ